MTAVTLTHVLRVNQQLSGLELKYLYLILHSSFIGDVGCESTGGSICDGDVCGAINRKGIPSGTTT